MLMNDDLILIRVHLPRKELGTKPLRGAEAACVSLLRIKYICSICAQIQPILSLFHLLRKLFSTTHLLPSGSTHHKRTR